MLVPPTRRHERSPVNLPSWLETKLVCMASSRVGESTSARTPPFGSRVLSLSSMGTRNAAVFPEPVRAMATTSTPDSSAGIALRCTGVGTLKPIFMIPLNTCGIRPVTTGKSERMSCAAM